MKYPRRSVALFIALFMLLLSGCTTTEGDSSDVFPLSPSSDASKPSASRSSVPVESEENLSTQDEQSMSTTYSEPEALAHLEREFPAYTTIQVELETEDYYAVLDAFVETYREHSMSVPTDNIYAITDFIVRDTKVDTSQLEGDELYKGILSYAVKPLYWNYYVRAGETGEGTGDLEGYLLRHQTFYISTEDYKVWVLRRCTSY